MKYIGQIGSCCQLVTAVNAARFLGHRTPLPGSVLFELMIDAVGCRYGSALQVERAYPLLKLDYKDGPPNHTRIARAIAARNPVGISTWLGCTGFHSALVVSVVGDVYEVVNLVPGEPPISLRRQDVPFKSTDPKYSLGRARVFYPDSSL